MSADARLAELGIQLPAPPKPAGVYRPIVIVGNLAYLSGHGPLRDDGSFTTGKVGKDLSEEDGYAAARQTGLALLATMKTEFGSIDRVKRVIKSLGMVNCGEDFANHPQVINGFSELMVDVFGDAGRGARSAVGMGSLPGNIAVEIETIVEFE